MNSVANSEKPRLGQRLVEVGLLSAADLEELLQRQRDTGLPLGRMLVEGGYVPGHSVAMALADQHGGLLKTEYGFATGWSGAVPARPVERPLERPVERPQAAQRTDDVGTGRPISGLRIAQPPAPDAGTQTETQPADLRARSEELQAQLRAQEQAEPATDDRGRRWRLFGR